MRSKIKKSALISMIGGALCVGCGSSNNSDLDAESSIEQETAAEIGLEAGAPLVQENSDPEFGAAQSAIEFGAHLYIADYSGVSGPEQSLTARFYRLATPLELAPELREQSSLDTCEIGSERSQFNAEALDFPIDHIIIAADQTPIQVSLVNAGQSVELTTVAGSYLSLMITPEDETDIEYTAEAGADMTTSVPSELKANVTGGVFPAFEWQWVKPQQLEGGLKEAIRSIQSEPTLSWTAASQSDSAQSRIQIYAGYINEVTGEYQSFQCELNDNGTFDIPDDVQSLYTDGFVAHFVDVVRYTRHVETVNDIAVVNVYMQKL